jgi:hypothetical protein
MPSIDREQMLFSPTDFDGWRVRWNAYRGTEKALKLIEIYKAEQRKQKPNFYKASVFTGYRLSYREIYGEDPPLKQMPDDVVRLSNSMLRRCGPQGGK